MNDRASKKFAAEYNSIMLRAMFQSLFWAVVQFRKKTEKLKQKDIADSLGIDKSNISRSFSQPRNWTIDKMAALSEVLNVDLEVSARDRMTGRLFTAQGEQSSVQTFATVQIIDKNKPQSSGAYLHDHETKLVTMQ